MTFFNHKEKKRKRQRMKKKKDEGMRKKKDKGGEKKTSLLKKKVFIQSEV
jgi:hypothetical protein